jgi:hypothetical protein
LQAQLAPQLHLGPQVQGLHEQSLVEHLPVISRLLDGPELDDQGLRSSGFGSYVRCASFSANRSMS